MSLDNRTWFQKGLKAGIPIALGYFAVSFTLGITAKNAGLTALQAMLASFTLNASAGEFAGFTLIATGAGYLEIAIMEFVANARYLLMSCALTQKLRPETSLRHRMLIAFDVTDEIFGVSIAAPGWLNPFFTYGVICVAAPGWCIGTYLGVFVGNLLPASLVSALSVGLYGMFLAVIIPPARKNRIVAGLVALSMALSFLLSRLPVTEAWSSGTRIILLTIVISAAAALLFPVQTEQPEASEGGTAP